MRLFAYTFLAFLASCASLNDTAPVGGYLNVTNQINGTDVVVRNKRGAAEFLLLEVGSYLVSYLLNKHKACPSCDEHYGLCGIRFETSLTIVTRFTVNLKKSMRIGQVEYNRTSKVYTVFHRAVVPSDIHGEGYGKSVFFPNKNDWLRMCSINFYYPQSSSGTIGNFKESFSESKCRLFRDQDDIAQKFVAGIDTIKCRHEHAAGVQFEFGGFEVKKFNSGVPMTLHPIAVSFTAGSPTLKVSVAGHPKIWWTFTKDDSRAGYSSSLCSYW